MSDQFTQSNFYNYPSYNNVSSDLQSNNFNNYDQAMPSQTSSSNYGSLDAAAMVCNSIIGGGGSGFFTQNQYNW